MFIISLRFPQKMAPNDNRFREKMTRLSRSDDRYKQIRFRAFYGPMFPLRSQSPIALCPHQALYPLYGPLPPLRPTVLSMALCLLYSHLSPSKALFLLFSPLSPSTIFCTIYAPAVLCHLYGPLFTQRTFVPSTAYYLFYGPLSFLRPSVSSTAICTPPDPSVPYPLPLFFSLSSPPPSSPRGSPTWLPVARSQACSGRPGLGNIL